MRDLNEVEEIAGLGPMRLILCDMALERARLALARSEAFAPLNGLSTNSPPKPQLPSEARGLRFHREAAMELATAANFIETCGYHRRDIPPVRGRPSSVAGQASYFSATSCSIALSSDRSNNADPWAGKSQV